jgi:hypothetical protein
MKRTLANPGEMTVLALLAQRGCVAWRTVPSLV